MWEEVGGGRKKVLREVWEVLEKSVLGCGG